MVLVLADAVGHDPAARLNVHHAVLVDPRAEHQGGVHVTRVAEVTHGAAVGAPFLALHLGDYLHGADLGRAGHGARRKAGPQGVVGRQFGPEVALHMRDQVHHVGELLHVHELRHRHGAGPADPADVVSAQVDQHDVLGALFLAALQLRFVGVVLARCRAPGPGPGDGVGGGPAAVDGDHRLDGRAHDLKIVQVQVIHVGRRVDAAESPVDLERVGLRAAREALGIDHLDHIARVDVLDALVDYLGVLFRREIGLNVSGHQLLSPVGSQLRRQVQRLRQPADHLVDLRRGLGVGPVNVTVQVDVAHHLDVVSNVVEQQQGVTEHEYRLGHSHGVGGHVGHPGLEVPDGVVGQVAHRAAVETGQPLHRDQPVLVHLLLDGQQGVDLPQGLFDAGFDHLVGVGADEAIAANALPAFNAFQQERIWALGHLQIGGDRCFQVRVYRAEDRDQVPLSGHLLNLFQSRLVHLAAPKSAFRRLPRDSLRLA